MRNILLPSLALILIGACSSSNNNKTPDAPPAQTDAAADGTPAATPDCASYCTTIQMNCMGANAQYPDVGHCMAACASFDVGTTGQATGNTLGCRIYHAGAPAVTNAMLHCPHAGPGGDLTDVVAPPSQYCGDACTSFCKLEIMACGTTTSAPTTGQYADMNACMSACANFPNSTHPYATTAKGDSLACRLYHATNAAMTGNAAVHCPHTAQTPMAPATGGTNPCLAGSTATP